MKYKVIAGTTIRELSDNVNKFLKKGWRPQGGISRTSGTKGLYYQAVIKTSKTKAEEKLEQEKN